MFNTERLEKFQESNKNLNIYEIIPFDKGLNSHLFRISLLDNEEDLLLKFYTLPSSTDRRNRCDNEIKALNYLNKLDIHNIPRLKDYNKSQGWIIMNIIKGQKIGSINHEYLQEIIQFIINSNYKFHDTKSSLNPASDSLLNLEKHFESIYLRCTDLLNIVSSNRYSRHILLIVELIKKKIEKEIEEQKVNYKNFSLHDLCFSQSDVGIHNIISTEHGLAYVDFEYAGVDHISKLLADLIVQPECPLNASQEKMLISGVYNTEMFTGNEWIKILHAIKPLTSLKWCLIIIKKLLITQNTSRVEELFNIYYENTTKPLLK